MGWLAGEIVIPAGCWKSVSKFNVESDQPRQHSLAAPRYESGLADAEWLILDPLLLPPRRYKRKRKWPMRRIVEAISFVMRAGCAWNMLPDGFPLPLAVYHWFARFREDSIWRRSTRLRAGWPDRQSLCSRARQPECQDGRGRRSAQL